MTASTRLFETVDALTGATARLIADGIESARVEGRAFLLGCPGGRTPRPVYQSLGRLAAEESLDFSDTVVVMMDDYLDGSGGRLDLVDTDAHYSCRGFAEREIRGVFNRGLPESKQLSTGQVWFPDPAEPGRYDRRIEAAGGIDLFLVASGASDGHVAFCGPGADIDGTTAVVELARQTRADNMITFPEFAEISEVPTHGVSVGLGTIRKLSKSVLLLLHGPDKQESARRVARGNFDPQWPATFIHECADGAVWLDEQARGI